MTKLPVARLARHAYLDAIGNLRGLVQIGGLWLLLSWAFLLLARDGSAFFTAAADLAITIGAAAIAVAWHRHLLLGEPLAGRMAPLNPHVARYFVLTVLVALLVSTVPLVVLMLVGGGALLEGGEVGMGLLLVPASALACLYLALRLQLVFPATAIGDKGMSFAQSWDATRGNGWRLFAGFLLVTLPVAATAIAATLFLGWLADATGSVVLGALADLTAIGNAWLQAPLIASFLSFAYTWFRGQAQAAA